MLQPPDPSVNPDRSSRTALDHADVGHELVRLRPADVDDLRSRRYERPLRPLIAEYTAIFGSTWRPATRRKHRDDFGRFVRWLEDHDRPITTGSFDFATLVEFVDELRTRPKVAGVWRGDPGATERSRAVGPTQTLSANSVNTYVRPLRSLAIWLVEEGIVTANPFSTSQIASERNGRT